MPPKKDKHGRIIDASSLFYCSSEVDEAAFDAEVSAAIGAQSEFMLLDGESLEITELSRKRLSLLKETPFFITASIRGGFSRYLTLESIKSGIVDKPNRFWPNEVIWDFAEQINTRQPVGYMGHDAIFNMHELPKEIPIIWLSAAKGVDLKTNTAITLAKGYVYANSNLRQHFLTGAVDSFSVFTVGDGEWKEEADGSEVLHMTEAQLLSFDPVRKGTEGILGTKVVSIEKEAASLTDEEKKRLEAEAAKSSGDNSLFLKRINELETEAVNNARAVAIGKQICSVLGCEIADILTVVENLKRDADGNRVLMIESACAKIPESIRTHILETLKGRTNLKTKTEIEAAVTSEMAMLQEVVKSLMTKAETSPFSFAPETVASDGGFTKGWELTEE